MRMLDEINSEFISEMDKLSHQSEPVSQPEQPAETQTEPLKAEGTGTVRKTQKQSVMKDLFFLLMKIAAIVLAFMLLFTFMFGIVRHQDPAMEPAVKDGDLVVYYRYNSKGYMPDDVIALKYFGKVQIRRVVAVAGDIVDITEDGLVINGALQQELDIYKKTERYEDGVSFPLTVPEGQVFVLGDNRTDSTDSRIYGCVKISDTLGKVMTVVRRRGI